MILTGGDWVESTAPPEAVWDLIARPDRWHEWSPYVRGGEDLGEPEVEEGAFGQVRLAGGIKLPAEIIEVKPGRTWTWRVGGIELEHEVEPASRGSRLAMRTGASELLWKPAALVYGPVVDIIATRAARVAER